MTILKIGEYFAVRLIGEGGQAKIYSAIKQNTLVAIKIYDVTDSKADQLFLQEKQLLSSLDHKNILAPLQYRLRQKVLLQNQESIQRNIVIMKFKQNGDLMDQINKNGKLDSKIILYLIKQIFDCLVYLSRNQTFHGDLKAQNLLLDSSFKPLLIDFGFICRKNQTHNKSYPKQPYIAPQVCRGFDYTQKSQAFSLGVLIFILSFGYLPFKCTKHTDLTYRALLQGKPKLFWKYFQQKQNFIIDENLKSVIINLLEPNPKRRWNYANLLQSDWFSGETVSQKEFLLYFQERNKKKMQIQQQKYTQQLQITDNEQSKAKQAQMQLCNDNN